MKLEGKQIGVFIALILGIILAFLPVQSRQIQLNSQDLSQAILDNGDRIDPQILSQWIVEGNTDFILIDIRSFEEFQAGHIKTAVNMPLPELIEKETIESLNSNKLLILYSNGVSHASQAWVILHSAGKKNVLVLEGGLNYWNKVILNPEAPGDYASNDEILIYRTKAAIANTLGGGSVEIQENDTQLSKPKAPLLKERKRKVNGGC